VVEVVVVTVAEITGTITAGEEEEETLTERGAGEETMIVIEESGRREVPSK